VNSTPCDSLSLELQQQELSVCVSGELGKKADESGDIALLHIAISYLITQSNLA